VPQLNGRIVRFFDKTLGREMLRPARQHDLRYPDTAGIAASVHAHRRAPAWPAHWRAERSGEGQMLLSATLENGLQARRRITLTESGLALETTVWNPTPNEIAAAIQHRAEAAPLAIDEEALAYTLAPGNSIRRPLIEAGQPPEGRLQFDAPALLPEGLHLPLSGFFTTSGEATRALAQWTAKTPPAVAFTHWSDEARLAPGAALRLASFYSFYGRK